MPGKSKNQHHDDNVAEDLLRFVQTFEDLSLIIMGKEERQRFGKQLCREFLSFFGTTRQICSILWSMIQKKNNHDLPRGAAPKHLLWALLFMKTYANETILSSTLKVDAKTARKWIWWAAEEISNLGDDVVCILMN